MDKKNIVKKRKTDITEQKEMGNIELSTIKNSILNPTTIKKLEEGVYHTGDKILYETPPDVEWNCCCIKGDKDLCVFLFKCGIMSAVLGFCFIQLVNNNNDGFYISTISLILGGVMGGNTTTKDKDEKKKKGI